MSKSNILQKKRRAVKQLKFLFDALNSGAKSKREILTVVCRLKIPHIKCKDVRCVNKFGDNEKIIIQTEQFNLDCCSIKKTPVIQRIETEKLRQLIKEQATRNIENQKVLKWLPRIYKRELKDIKEEEAIKYIQWLNEGGGLDGGKDKKLKYEKVNYGTVTMGQEIELEGLTLRFPTNIKPRDDRKIAKLDSLVPKTGNPAILYIVSDMVQNAPGQKEDKPTESEDPETVYKSGKFYTIELVTTPVNVNDEDGIEERHAALVNVVKSLVKLAQSSTLEKEASVSDLKDMVGWPFFLLDQKINPGVFPGRSAWILKISPQATYGFCIKGRDLLHQKYKEVILKLWKTIEGYDSTSANGIFTGLYQAILSAMSVTNDPTFSPIVNYIKTGSSANRMGDKEERSKLFKYFFADAKRRNLIEVLPKAKVLPDKLIEPDVDWQKRVYNLIKDVGNEIYGLTTFGEVTDTIQGGEILLYEIRRTENIPKEHIEELMVTLMKVIEPMRKHKTLNDILPQEQIGRKFIEEDQNSLRVNGNNRNIK